MLASPPPAPDSSATPMTAPLTLSPLIAARSRAQLVAYCIVERDEGPPAWIRCGTARHNRDGSVNVRLDALPLSGELHLRPTDEAALEELRARVRTARPDASAAPPLDG